MFYFKEKKKVIDKTFYVFFPLQENPCQHPVIIFRNVKFDDLAALVDFMYQGEVNVVQEQLGSFLTTAELLAVQGLTDGTGKDSDDMAEVKIISYIYFTLFLFFFQKQINKCCCCLTSEMTDLIDFNFIFKG